jgi:uncharacterized protein DUF222/HNH endonuclease
MCGGDEPAGSPGSAAAAAGSRPATVAAALTMLEHAFDFFNATDVAALPTAAQGETLRALERAESRQTAIRARVLSAFGAGGGPEADGQGSTRTWLRWQTRVTTGAAAAAVGWMRRLAAHPVVERALAAGEISASWARQICDWTDRLPEGIRDDADRILAEAARAGADLRDLAVLAEEMYRRSRGPDDGDDGFADRYLRLGVTFAGAGRIEGDLTPGCTAAVSAVLDALGKKAGPEDTRTAAQRRHDALAEACKRLITGGLLPGRAGQPTHIQVHMSLDQLRGSPGAARAERAWAASRGPGWLAGPEAEAAACDATVVPVVTGHVDWAAVDRLTSAFLASQGTSDCGQAPASPAPPTQPDGERLAGPVGPGVPPGGGLGPGPGCPGCGGSGGDGQPAARGGRAGLRASQGEPAAGERLAAGAGGDLSPAARGRLGRALLALAADALSGPGGLAAWLRASLDGAGLDGMGRDGTGLNAAGLDGTVSAGAGHRGGAEGRAPGTGGSGDREERRAGTHDGAAPCGMGTGPPWRPLTSVSLPLDIGAATESIPAHLRRAVTLRHPCCAFPGCDLPARVCDIHHIVPRSRGGPTALHNLAPLCTFHHQIAVHRWGWTLHLYPDGATAATNRTGDRTLYSHGPPARAA